MVRSAREACGTHSLAGLLTTSCPGAGRNLDRERIADRTHQLLESAQNSSSSKRLQLRLSLLPRAPDSFDRPSIELVRISALPLSGARHAIAFSCNRFSV